MSDFQICLFFPKEFEFLTFVRSTNVLHCAEVEPRMFIVVIMRNGQKIHFRALIIGDSDFGFNYLISKHLSVLEDKTFILIGSCGSNNKEDFKKMFRITKATKVDRGLLVGNRFERRRGKELISKSCDMLLSGILSKESYSSCFLNDSIYSEAEVRENCVYDMETFEFFHTCESLKVKSYYAYRVVTDWVKHSDEPITKEVYSEGIEPEWATKFDPNLSYSDFRKELRKTVAIDDSFFDDFVIQDCGCDLGNKRLVDKIRALRS